jgi:hypothetical protein
MLRALQWYADDRHLARRAHDGSRRPPGLLCIVGRAFVAREPVIEGWMRPRIGVQGRRGYVCDEVFVEAATLAGWRRYR